MVPDSTTSDGVATPASAFLSYDERLAALAEHQQSLIRRINEPETLGNGIFKRFRNPVLTAEHTPLAWRYDLDRQTNPHLIERMGVGSVFNAGAIHFEGRYLLVARVEGADRKSFFAVAESPNGVDNFQFWEKPIELPETENPDVNVYDMRLTRHEDGWIYGVFCTERKDAGADPSDVQAADAQCGIVRTKDLERWERLPDLETPSNQQRNVVLHPELIDGRYAFYTRPQDGFIEAGTGGGIAWGTVADITRPVIEDEQIIEPRKYHTIKEAKIGLGPPPIRTEIGWLHLAHGVRTTAAGLRYVLYLFVAALDDPTDVILRPGGALITPQGEERVGDVSNVVFSNGWIRKENGDVLIYYASSDTRQHVALSSVERLLDYAQNTPPDGARTGKCVRQRIELIEKNQTLQKNGGAGAGI